MSETRSVKSEINPSEFVQIAREMGYRITDGGNVELWSTSEPVDHVIHVDHHRLNIGVKKDGTLLYDHMIGKHVSEITAGYFERRLTKKGIKVQRERKGNKIVMRVQR